MKNLLILGAIICICGMLAAQTPSNKRFSQSQFNLSDVNTITHSLSDDFTNIQVNLKTRSLSIEGKSYSIYSKGIDRFLIDEEKNIYAFLIGKKIKVGKETYIVKGSKLLSTEGEVICNSYKKVSKGTQYIGISRGQNVSSLVLGLFYYKQLLKMKEEQNHQYGPIYLGQK